MNANHNFGFLFFRRYGKKEGYVISNGTFSKIMGPGVRLGWIESSENIIDRLRTRYVKIAVQRSRMTSRQTFIIHMPNYSILKLTCIDLSYGRSIK